MFGNSDQFCSLDESMFFNPDSAQEVCPKVWLGPYSALSHDNFLERHNIKIIINCLSTGKFLRALEQPQVAISSDVIILSLDPSFSVSDFETQELVLEFTRKFNRILQNYLNYFYVNNPDSTYLIHQIPNNQLLLSIRSPILQGNLKLQFFVLVRLMNLLKSINSNVQCLVLSDTGNSNLSTGLITAYLMDCYNYNIKNSYTVVHSARPSVSALNNNFYDDLLIIENLKKFSSENNALKQNNPGVLIKNYKLKRRNDEEEDDLRMDDDMEYNEICVGGDRKRRFHR